VHVGIRIHPHAGRDFRHDRVRSDAKGRSHESWVFIDHDGEGLDPPGVGGCERGGYRQGTIAASSARAGISIARKPAPSARGCPLKILLASSGHGSFGVGDCARAPGGPHGAPDCDGGAEYYAKHGSSHVASFARIATLKTPGVTACITPIRARHTRRWHCVHYSPQKGSTDPFPTALHCVRLPI
jgi:hypothetical protein